MPDDTLYFANRRHPSLELPAVADLFAGAGGFSLGFVQSGYRIALAIERDAWACDTLRYNHPETVVVAAEIEGLSDAELGELGRDGIDVLIGGPPCQGFSVSNLSAGDPKDPRNSLFMEMVRAASVWCPRLVIMENVPGLLRHTTGHGAPVIDLICEEFAGLGYSVGYGTLRAADFGVPQIRERLFVVASRASLAQPLPTATHTPPANGTGSVKQSLFSESGLLPGPTLWESISDLPPLNAGEGAEEAAYPGPPLTEYQCLLRGGSDTLWNHVAMRHSRRMVSRFAAMKCGESVSDVAAEHRPPKRGDPGSVSDRAYDQNNRRMYPDRPCHTIPASFYANFVHPFQHRNFTPREGARLQSFPDSYRFMGKPTVVSHRLLAREGRHEELHLCQYNQIGNAVAPIVAKAIADHLRDALLAPHRSDADVPAR